MHKYLNSIPNCIPVGLEDYQAGKVVSGGELEEKLDTGALWLDFYKPSLSVHNASMSVFNPHYTSKAGNSLVASWALNVGGISDFDLANKRREFLLHNWAAMNRLQIAWAQWILHFYESGPHLPVELANNIISYMRDDYYNEYVRCVRALLYDQEEWWGTPPVHKSADGFRKLPEYSKRNMWYHILQHHDPEFWRKKKP